MILERCDADATTRSPNNIEKHCVVFGGVQLSAYRPQLKHTHWQPLTIYMDKYIGFEMSHLAIDSFDYNNTFFFYRVNIFSEVKII